MKLNLPCMNHNLRLKVAALCLGVAVFAASSAASGYAIIIEPDDYVAGTNLSTIAPYVTLQSRDGYGIKKIFMQSSLCSTTPPPPAC
jgi:hypothetical protein